MVAPVNYISIDYKSLQKRIDINSKACVICLEEFTPLDRDLAYHAGEGIAHPSHRKCLEVWVRVHKKCPNCLAPATFPTPWYKDRLFTQNVYGILGTTLCFSAEELSSQIPTNACSAIFGLGMILILKWNSRCVI